MASGRSTILFKSSTKCLWIKKALRLRRMLLLQRSTCLALSSNSGSKRTGSSVVWSSRWSFKNNLKNSHSSNKELILIRLLRNWKTKRFQYFHLWWTVRSVLVAICSNSSKTWSKLSQLPNSRKNKRLLNQLLLNNHQNRIKLKSTTTKFLLNSWANKRKVNRTNYPLQITARWC